MSLWHFTGPPGSDFDDLGFIRPRGSIEEHKMKEYEEWYAQYLPKMVHRRKRWDKENPRVNHHLLQRFVRKGIPHIYRKDIWMRCCSSAMNSSWKKYPVPEDIVKAIWLDLPRTFPDNMFLKSDKQQRVLGRALYAIAQYLPSVGYCQGLNFVAALILLVINDEHKAIDLLVHLVSQRKDYYGTNMIGLRRDMHVLHQLLRKHCPRIIVTIERLDVGLEMLIGKWFVCWFVECLPMETVLRIWDCLIYEGDEWLFRIAIVLLQSNMIEIAKCERIDEILTKVQDIGISRTALYCHQLLMKSSSLQITRNEIEELRVEATRVIAD